MFNNILVAVDGSEPSKKALNYALELAEKLNGKITLIHVYSTVVALGPPVDVISGPSLTPASAAIASKMVEEVKHRAEQILDDAEQIAKQHGISVEKLLREGDAVKEIAAVAKEGKFDLVVVGHRGLSKLGELVLGAVSEGVSHKAPCPVLIVK